MQLPTLAELGRDLLVVSWRRRVLSLTAPFVFAAGFFILAAHGYVIAAIGCVALISFLTYASISHDLLHATIGLPPRLNEILLTAMELLTLRSGHAYRTVHLHHHARFPAEDDLEGAAASMTWWRALAEGVLLQPRIWRVALQHDGRNRRWVALELALIAGVWLACLALMPLTPLPALYAVLVTLGSWVYPFMTAWVVHDANGDGPLEQTRLYRGWLLRVIALDHLYHLEHHLYPRVPHHRWPELARRLDPHFAAARVTPVVLGF